MIESQREALAARVLSFSGADHTEVSVESQDRALSRFTHNAIHQNVASCDVTVRVRAILGGRTGVAATNLYDDERALRECVERAIEMAKLAPADPDRPALPAGGNFTVPPQAYADATASASPDARAELCQAIFRVAQTHGLWAAGFVTTGAGGISIVNSSGARASFDGTDAGINVKMNGGDSTGFAESYDTDVRRLDPAAVAERSAEKARASADPAAVEAGPWTVILEPPAFGELLSYLDSHFSAQAYDEGSSFLSGALGEQLLSENVSIGDDYAHPLAPGMPFDFEGQPTQRLPLVERGVARNVVTDSYWAHKLRRENTGHALPAPNAWGPQATHLVVAPGTLSPNELVAQTKRGLLVSRFWYIRTVDQKQAIVTGMTRDGTFLIEDGKLAGGVRNMRFNVSIVQTLRDCAFASDLRRTGGYSYSLVVPSVKIERFTFTSGTNF